MIKNSPPEELLNPSVFTFYRPEGEIKGVLSIPHSGEIIPQEFSEFLVTDTFTRNRDVDKAVFDLVDLEKLQQAGIATLVAKVHRICVDLNRSRDLALLNWDTNSYGEQLVTKRPDPERSEHLLLAYYNPYYTLLKALIESYLKISPKMSFIDLHSMPSKATDYHLKKNPHQPQNRPDFCISDQMGESAKADYTDFAKEVLAKSYSQVLINKPYVGGHITVQVDRLFPQMNNIQIEINRANYMDEAKQAMLPAKVSFLRPILTQALIETFYHSLTL